MFPVRRMRLARLVDWDSLSIIGIAGTTKRDIFVSRAPRWRPAARQFCLYFLPRTQNPGLAVITKQSRDGPIKSCCLLASGPPADPQTGNRFELGQAENLLTKPSVMGDVKFGILPDLLCWDHVPGLPG